MYHTQMEAARKGIITKRDGNCCGKGVSDRGGNT